MEQVLPVLLQHGLCKGNYSALYNVNKICRKLVSGEQNYYQEHKLRYFGKPKPSKKRYITLVIRGKVSVTEKVEPKVNSTWTIEIWKDRHKGTMTVKYGHEIDSITFDLTACKLTNSRRLLSNQFKQLLYPDPWIVTPLCFVRKGSLVLYIDPTLNWVLQTTNGTTDRNETKPPRFLRVALGYLDFRTYMTYTNPYIASRYPLGYCWSADVFLNRLK